jgi:pyruvate dehydrogenase E1 component
MYLLRKSTFKDAKHKAQLWGSGAILNEVVKAQEILESQYDVAADVWSVTSYKELRRDAMDADRWNMFHPEEKPRVPYITQQMKETEGVIIAASDYVKALPDMLARWLPRPLLSLGTEGYGRSENRASLRDFFEVDARYVVLATLTELAREGQIRPSAVTKAIKDMNINPEKLNPLTA